MELIMMRGLPASAMLDGKPHKQIIWKMIRPHGSSTFRKDIDA